MVENLLQFLMGMVDSYLVAFLGLVALSGVSLANNIMAVYQAIFIALGQPSLLIWPVLSGKGIAKSCPKRQQKG